MAYVWAGVEDIDYLQGGTVSVQVGASAFRASFSRCGLYNGGVNNVRSTTFPGGAVASAWFSCQFQASALGTNRKIVGVGLSTTNDALIIGMGASVSSKVTLATWDGSSYTILATESGTSLTTALTRLDMQITSFGSLATVNVYLNFVLALTFTGDVRIGTMTTGFDCVTIPPYTGNQVYISETVVMTDDTRQYPALQDLALTSTGTTSNWTNNTVTNINGTSFSDTNPTSSNTNAQLQQYNVTDLGSSAYVPAFVKWTVRAALSATPAVTQLAIGINDGGSVAYGTGSTKAIVGGTGVFAQYEQCDLTNPNGGGAWTNAVVNGLQVNLEALT